MIKTIRSHLGVKLFLSYLLVILVGVAAIAISARFSLPEAFNRHMGAGMGAGNGQGMMQGNAFGRGVMPDLFQSFQSTFSEALLISLLVAAAVAIPLSLVLSRSVVAPVHAMTAASQRIAAGNYAERVKGTGPDELGRMGISFNQMAEKLQLVESMRRQLIGDVSHELRTPLTAIKGSMEGLMDGVLPPTAETYQQIRQEADRLGRLVDDLQELSRVEAGAYSLEMQPVDMGKLIQTTVQRLDNQARGKSIELHTNIAADLPPVRADADRIIQVLTNLVGNAIQYTPEEGRVTISASTRGKEVEVRVVDTGMGIPAEHLPHIFTRFYRADKSRSRQAGGGSGIGLTVAKYLVEAHGGSIRADSEGAGTGSCFSFTIGIWK